MSDPTPRCFSGEFRLREFKRLDDSEHVDVQDVDRMGPMSENDVYVSFCVDPVDEQESDRPTRSEPADFGGGESTGVQDL